MFTIYMIQNKINDWVYVGQTVNFGDRTRTHRASLRNKRTKCRKLQQGWDEYGEKAFEFFPVMQCETRETADIVEVALIAWYTELGLSYNMQKGGEGCSGYKRTPEGQAALTAKLKGRKFSDETKARMSAAKKGRKLSPEHAAKTSEALKRRVFTPEYREKLSESAKGNTHWKGRSHSEESKRKIAEGRTGENNPAYGKGKSPETVAKFKETWARKMAQKAQT